MNEKQAVKNGLETSQRTYLILPAALVFLLQITLLHVQFVKEAYINLIKHVQHTRHDAMLKFDRPHVIFFIHPEC